jgi:hypothetical protein
MSAHVIANGGAIVFWDCGPTSRQILETRLTQLGLEDYTPCPRTDAQSLKIALGDYADEQKQAMRRARQVNTTDDLGGKCRRDKIVQAHRNQKENGFELVDVTRGDESNDYVTDFSAKVVDSQVQISRGYAERGRLQQQFETAKATLGGNAVGRSLVELMGHLKGTALREAGGVYWIPDEGVTVWERVIDAFQEAGKNKVYVMRTVMDAQTVRAVNDAIVDEVLKASTALADEIKSGALGEQAIENRLCRAKALHARVAEYEAILGQTMTHLHSVIGVAELAASSAVAIREDKSVFDEMFAEV